MSKGADPMHLAAPPRSALWREARALIDVARMGTALLRPHGRREHPAQGSPVIVLPGFGASDRLMAPLRRYLAQQGFVVEGWGLGVNRAGLDLPHRLTDISEGWDLPAKEQYRREGGVALLCDRMVTRVAQAVERLGQPVTLVGWSLGGTIAREVARELPDAVRQVITLGSPVIGGPKYTAAARALQARGLDLDWIEREVKRRDHRPIQQPIISIISRSDGIVSWSAAIDHISPRVRHVEIQGSHLGMAFNPTVWRLVVEALRENASHPAV